MGLLSRYNVVMKQQPVAEKSAVQVGLTWGAAGGVFGFFASLLGALSGMLIAVVMGVTCGRRAARATAGEKPGVGAVAGLIAGSVAAPVYVAGAAAGSLVVARSVGNEWLAATLGDILGSQVSGDEAWRLYLLGMAVAAVLEAGLLIFSATVAGAWVLRGRAKRS